MSEGEKARVRTGRPPVITMIRTTKRSAKKRAGGGEEGIVQRRSTSRLHRKMAADRNYAGVKHRCNNIAPRRGNTIRLTLYLWIQRNSARFHGDAIREKFYPIR